MPESRRRVAFVAHCLVNQNAKVSEFARCPGVVVPLVERLREAGYEIQQLPCPEMSFLGVARWWQSREQYDTPGYRRHCRDLARTVVDTVAFYTEHEYDVVIIGLDGSPSSGVRLTSTKTSWGGRPEGAVAGGSDRYPGDGGLDGRAEAGVRVPWPRVSARHRYRDGRRRLRHGDRDEGGQRLPRGQRASP